MPSVDYHGPGSGEAQPDGPALVLEPLRIRASDSQDSHEHEQFPKRLTLKGESGLSEVMPSVDDFALLPDSHNEAEPLGFGEPCASA